MKFLFVILAALYFTSVSCTGPCGTGPDPSNTFCYPHVFQAEVYDHTTRLWYFNYRSNFITLASMKNQHDYIFFHVCNQTRYDVNTATKSCILSRPQTMPYFSRCLPTNVSLIRIPSTAPTYEYQDGSVRGTVLKKSGSNIMSPEFVQLPDYALSFSNVKTLTSFNEFALFDPTLCIQNPVVG